MKSLNLKAFGGWAAATVACALLGCLVFVLTAAPVRATDPAAVEADSANGHENLPPGVTETTESGETGISDAGAASAAEDGDPAVHLPAVIFIIAAVITGAAFLFFIRKFLARRP